MYTNRFLKMHFSKHTRHVKANNARPSNSIIRINIKISKSLDACTCVGVYCSAEPLSMGFTLPRTRLVHDHLWSLSYQRLGPPATLATWINMLYVRLIDSLEFQMQPCLNPYLIIYTITSPWNLVKRLMELILAHTKTMFPHQVHILSQNIIISC